MWLASVLGESSGWLLRNRSLRTAWLWYLSFAFLGRCYFVHRQWFAWSLSDAGCVSPMRSVGVVCPWLRLWIFRISYFLMLFRCASWLTGLQPTRLFLFVVVAGWVAFDDAYVGVDSGWTPFLSCAVLRSCGVLYFLIMSSEFIA